MCGYTVGLRAVDAVSYTDFSLLVGLPVLPSPPMSYRLLQDRSVHDSLDFQVALGPRLVARGPITPSTSMLIAYKPLPVRR